MSDTVLAQAKKTIGSKGLLKKGDRVLACISGGPDSMALLSILTELKNQYALTLTIAHLDHMLRGKESLRDFRFVKEVSRAQGIPFVGKKRDIKKISKRTGLSIEESAREARYKFFEYAAKLSQSTKIATAHNLDDQAETVLMRIIKGSGSLGLSGIPYKRMLNNLVIIRPLLDIDRKSIEAYLKKERLPFKIDSTNSKTQFTRNKIRHFLIPKIEKTFNPKTKEALSSLSKSLSDEYDYLIKEAKKRLKKYGRISSGKISISLTALASSHIAIRRILVRHAIRILKGDLKKITFGHCERIENIIFYGNKSCDLPGNIEVKRCGKDLILSKKQTKNSRGINKVQYLSIPGSVEYKNISTVIFAEQYNKLPAFKKGSGKNSIEYLNGDNLKIPLKIRFWRSGDRMKPFGMKNYKKLHDIFIDEKIERPVRSQIPIILSGKKIVWAAGVKLSEDFRVTGGTKTIIRLGITRKPQL